MNTTTQAIFKQIRNRGVPLCAFETADPAATIKTCLKVLNGTATDSTICVWDIIQGLVGLSDKGKQFITNLCGDVEPRIATGNPAECLQRLMDSDNKAAAKCIIFWCNAHRFIDNESVAQGFWNLRDKFKGIGATLVLLAPIITLPSELKQDVVVINEPLPDEAELSDIVTQIVKDAELKPSLVEPDRPVIVDTLRGLSAFAAEQCLAMSLSKTGIDKTQLWERKRKMIEQTPGLAVWSGGETFDDLGGLDNLKTFLRSVLKSGKTPVRAIGFIDEIEKGLAGSAGDTSGTSQDQLQVFLKVMQDLNIPGMILLGHAGTGKSAIAKAAGSEAGCPVIAIDTGSMKGSLVGESERRIRTAMEVFKAVSQGKGLFIATCNKIASLPPELRRRFTLGTFFVDLPSTEEQSKIWDIWLKRYDIKLTEPRPFCIGWTGAEIKACCDVSYRTGLSLKEAAAFIVPVVKSAPDQVSGLRNQAHGRFICASKSGVYVHADRTQSNSELTGRKINL